MLQRLYGTEVLAGEQFSDLLEHPMKYDRPCLWHEPIRVGRHIPNGTTVHWENIPITLYPMSGHTRFATLICMEIDGTRVAHTGDQAFFDTEGGLGYQAGARMFTNHVYKNGLDLGCYKRFLEDLKRFEPEMVITGHTRPYRTSPEWYAEIGRAAEAFDDVHTTLMLLEDDDAHFGAESQGGKLMPYRAHAPDGGPIEFSGWVLNPFPTEQPARIRLVGPEGWQSETVTLSLGPREQKEIRLVLHVPEDTQCRRQPVALNLTVGGRPFGQVTEALVTVGMPKW